MLRGNGGLLCSENEGSKSGAMVGAILTRTQLGDIEIQATLAKHVEEGCGVSSNTCREDHIPIRTLFYIYILVLPNTKLIANLGLKSKSSPVQELSNHIYI